MTEKDKKPLDFEVKGLDFEVEWFPSRDRDHPRAGWAEAAQELVASGEDLPAWPQFANADDEREAEPQSVVERLQERLEGIDREQPAPELDREIELPGMDQVRADAARAERIKAIELRAAEIRAERDIQPPPQEQSHGFEL